MDNNYQELEKIYVAGFPKSGNTWLTRLLADVLGSPVGTGMKGKDNEEVASDFNEIILTENRIPKYKILKTHFLPAVLFREIDNEVKRVVYLKRDFRDIVISAFFHRFGINEKDVKFVNFSKIISGSPQRTLEYYRNRYRLWNHLKSICTDWGDNVGSWDKHITEWQEINNKNPDILIALTSYEELSKDTKGVILRIIQKLKLPKPSEKRLDISINRQSFENKKKYVQNLSEDSKIPLGKEFNVRFMRKGIVGDWKNFFSSRMAEKLHQLQGEALLENGFESDIGWHEKFPFILEY